jgi:hypothetical protein
MRPTLPDHGQAILLLDVTSRECTGEQYEAQRKVWSALKNDPLSTEEEMMWDAATKGVRFGVLCEMVSTFAGQDDAEILAASYLKGWVDTGMQAGFQLQ